MPRVLIDGLAVEVEAGTKVIAAAEMLGIKIPRFCYHPALGSVGACRMCAVKFLDGPVKGLQMSCMVDVQDGMVVSTCDPEAVEFRRYIIELLMMNHPHDCPVCDEGGQCLLQDETVSGGHSLRRFPGTKRTYRDQYLGVFLVHEMNRCIHCYRCSRFYREVAGYRDLGALQIANRVYFGRFEDGALESPFAGNLVDLCPTGVFTDKPARYRGRRWDFQRAPSICIHCSLGCNTIANVRYRSVVRIEARWKETVNGYFICDRGRFGFDYVNSSERPRRARVDGREMGMEEAVKTAGRKLLEIGMKYGWKSVAWHGSTRNSLETQESLLKICGLVGSRDPGFFMDSRQKQNAVQAVKGLDDSLAVSLGDISSADFILVVGADPVNEAPMLALAMRQAWRRNATVVVLDPRPIDLPMPFEYFPVAPGKLYSLLDRIVDLALEKKRASDDERGNNPLPTKASEGVSENENFDKSPDNTGSIASRIAEKLRSASFPVIVCGTDIVPTSIPIVAAKGARKLREAKGKAGLFYVLPGPNAFGGALLNKDDAPSLEELLDDIEQGAVRALVLVECDPVRAFPDRARILRAFGRLDLLVVLDYLPSEAAERADILIPTVTSFETPSTFINQEGRIQFAEAVFAGGAPLAQVSCGKHPPRIYDATVPGGDPKASWLILNRLAEVIRSRDRDREESHPLKWLARNEGAFASLQNRPYPFDDFRCLHGEFQNVETEAADAKEFSLTSLRQESFWEESQDRREHFELFAVESMFGTEELSRYAEPVRQAAKKPGILIHRLDAELMGFGPGDRIRLDLQSGTVEAQVTVSERMARGILILPRHFAWTWQVMGTNPSLITKEQITVLPEGEQMLPKGNRSQESGS